jgi:hypothetical protein
MIKDKGWGPKPKETLAYLEHDKKDIAHLAGERPLLPLVKENKTPRDARYILEHFEQLKNTRQPLIFPRK